MEEQPEVQKADKLFPSQLQAVEPSETPSRPTENLLQVLHLRSSCWPGLHRKRKMRIMLSHKSLTIRMV